MMFLIYILLPVFGAVIGYHLGQKDLIIKNPVKGVHQRRIVRIGILAVLLLSLSIFIIYLSNEKNPAYYELAKVFLGGLIVIGIIYAALHYEYSLNKNESDIRIKRSLATFEIINNWNKEPLVSYINEIKKFEKSKNFTLIKGNIDDLMKFLYDEKNAALLNSFYNIFNYFETIVAGVNEGIFDQANIKRFYESILLDYYRNYGSFINRKRSLEDNQVIWKEFTSLANLWSVQGK